MSERFALEWRETAGLRWLAWEGAGVTAVFPTREGGVSAAPWDTLDLGLSVGDEPAHVLENRRRLCAAVGLPLDRLVVPHQVHSTVTRWVGEAEAGRGARNVGTAIADCDGLLTGVPDLGLAIGTADCMPVVIAAAAADGLVLAAVHAGWRGALDGIIGQAAVALARRGRLLGAVVGPSIGPCCFVVDEALRARFAARFPGVARGNAVDLWAAATADLVAAGVPAGHITVAGICTACDARFFSHRRDQGSTGRHLAVAWRQGA
jgi:YfiH family protein